MENDLDLEVSVKSQNESTLSNSLESGLTVQSSHGDSNLKLDECGGWTNERHNSYLNYLENSFVKQLYSLIDGQTKILSRTYDVQSKSRKSNDQFKVLQNGVWQKVNFEKRRLETISDQFCFQKSSSRPNLGTDEKGNVLCNEEIKSSGFTRTFIRDSLGHEYSAQSNGEASGQNFEEEEEKGYNLEVSKKRKREAKFDNSSSNDQVVP